MRARTPHAIARCTHPQVHSAQHNLPANGKRQLLAHVHVPQPATPAASFVSGLPVELPPMDLQSVSPSGAVVRGVECVDEHACCHATECSHALEECVLPRVAHPKTRRW